MLNLTIIGKSIRILAAVGVVTSTLLALAEFNSPGTCPPYPIVGIPTCYIILVIFLAIGGSTFVEDRKSSRVIYFMATLVGLATATWFSGNQIFGTAKCPQFLMIPLCFIAFLTYSTLLFLKYREMLIDSGKAQP